MAGTLCASLSKTYPSMKIKWCGVFENVRKDPKYPTNYVYIDVFFGQTALDIKMSIEAFIELMLGHGMKLIDQEIMDVAD